MLEFATLESEALLLLPEDRARLAHSLLISLDAADQHGVTEAWLDEAERRAGEIDRGEVELIDAAEVSRKARAWRSLLG